jgi:hypothetical protein
MYEKLSEQEIEFMEMWYSPVALIENLIPENIKASHTWNESKETKCIKLRPYQFAMVNYSYMYAENPKLSATANFQLKKLAGTIFNIAGRNIGKSYLLVIDAFCTILHGAGDESCVASCDDLKLKKIASPLINLCREHPFFNVFKKCGKSEGIKGQPVEIETQHGHVCYGRNEKVDTPEPGLQFHGIHAKTWNYDEASYMSVAGSEKRIDSGASIGYIERLSGIPDLRIGSPLGEILRDKKNARLICRLPQYVREDWSKETQLDQAAKYKGQNSVAYKLNVEAEITEGAFSKWDMERIRKNCLKTDVLIKFFEIGKDLFTGIETLSEEDKQIQINNRLSKKIVLVRVPNKKTIIASDIGTTGSPSEVAIFFGDQNNKWKYHYQISLFKLTVKEQAYVFKWIYEILGGAFIVLDHTNADGRAITECLVKDLKIPLENVSDFVMTRNIEVDFLKNNKGVVLRDKNGKPLMREEYTKAWAIQKLEEMFYNSKLEIPYDEKFLSQFSNHWEKVSPGGRPVWGSSTEEHLVDTFLLFALCAWEKEFKNLVPQQSKRCLGFIE